MLTIEIKKDLYKAITSNSYLGKYEEYGGIIKFIEQIWDIDNMPSTDQRYNTARGDITKHIVDNNDWEIDYLYLEYLGLIRGDEQKYIKFLEIVVNPLLRDSKEDIELFVSLINEHLETSKNKMYIGGFIENLPVYRFGDISQVDYSESNQVYTNTLPFYFEGFSEQKEYPSFQIYRDNWDDYGYKSTGNLFYFKSINESISLGELKIMKKNNSSRIEEFMPKTFDNLDPNYCSVGQSINYYKEMKNIFGEDSKKIFLALRDVAFFSVIYDEFENESRFKVSLLRENSVEKLCRNLHYLLNDLDPDKSLWFNYRFKPPYAEEDEVLSFNFATNGILNDRIYALIGENGTGKTTILTQIATDFSTRNNERIIPHVPLYGKLFTISYSVFDHFVPPENTIDFNYIYCGLKKNKYEILSEEERISYLISAVKKIESRVLVNDWISFLKKFIPKELLLECVDDEINYNKLIDLYNLLSSGQSILMRIVSEIFAEIRYNSLILYDEPETHLHPNAISSLIEILFSLTEKYNSFCILGTHSPLIIREIPSKNVIVFERNVKDFSIRKLDSESFGENLTVITDEIFGNRGIQKHFKKQIDFLKESGHNYGKIVNILKNSDLPITLGVRLYVKSLFT